MKLKFEFKRIHWTNSNTHCIIVFLTSRPNYGYELYIYNVLNKK